MLSYHASRETEAQRHPCKAADGDAENSPSPGISGGMKAWDEDGACCTGRLSPPSPENNQQEAQPRGMPLTKHPQGWWACSGSLPGPPSLCFAAPSGVLQPQEPVPAEGAGTERDLSLSQVQYLCFCFVG